MDDLISRQAAIDAIQKDHETSRKDLEYEDDDYKYGFDKGYSHSMKVISELPSAQPEIIHCESCKHWKNEHICECLSRYGTFETPKNFYCGYGKEK